jgi:hypothetical protein
MVINPNQGQENQLVNKALTKVPRPHLTGMVLAQDIKFGDLQLNAIDDDGVVWVCTDIAGWWSLPDPETQDLDKGWGDGSYQSKGRYRARQIELSGTILVQDPNQVTKARDTLVRATDLVRNSAWLVVNESDYTKAVQVRLSGKPKIENVNARGRIDFSIGLLAVDPIKYRWYGDSTSTDLAKAQPKGASGSETGYVTANNQGNYNVGAVFEVEGPIVSPNFTIINETNGDMITVIEQTRGKMYRYPTSKAMLDGVATMYLTTRHDLSAGDEIEITLPETVSVNNFALTNNVATITTGSATHGFVANDKVTFTNVHASVNGLELVVASAPTYNTFTVGATNANVTSTAVTNASTLNITNQKFNGTHYVQNNSVNSNSFAFTFSVDYRDTVANVATVVANMSPSVFRDADILEIDTSYQEVALNGDASQKRGMLDAVIDWIKLNPGENLLQFDDSNPTKYFINRYYTVANATTNTDTTYLFTTAPHGYSTSDSVVIDNVSAVVNTNVSKTIANFSSTSNVVTAGIASHGYSTGDSVVVSGVSNVVDGLRTVTNVNANALTFTTTASGNSYTTVAPDGASTRKVTKVSSYSRVGNVVTVISNAHGYVNNSTLHFSGISNVVDGLYVVSAPNVNALTYVTRTSGNISSTSVTTGYVSRRFPITDNTTYQIAVTKSPATSNVGNSTSTVASGATVYTDNIGEIGVTKYSVDNVNNYVTLVTSDEHGFSTGELVTLNTEENVLKPFRVGSGINWRVQSFSRIANGEVTFTTVGLPGEVSSGFTANDSVQLTGVDDSIDGLYKIQTANNTSFAYTINTSNTVAVSNTYPDAGYIQKKLEVVYYTRSTTVNAVVAVESYTQSNALLTVTTKTTHNINNAHEVVLFGVANTLDYRVYTAANVNATARTFTVTAPYLANVNTTTVADGGVYNKTTVNVTPTVNLTGNLVFVTTRTPHRLTTGDSVLIEGLTSSVDGVHRIIETSSNARFGAVISSVAAVPGLLVKAATRPASNPFVTLTTNTAHGLSVGDAVYVDGTSQSTFNGDTVVYSVINTTAFSYSSSANTAANATALTGFVGRYPNVYATQEFPIVSIPNNQSLTYYSKYADTVNSVSETTLSNTAGEVVKNSDGTVRVYFKSGWIG